MCSPCKCFNCGSQTDRDVLYNEDTHINIEPTVLHGPPTMSQVTSTAVSRMSINPFTGKPVFSKSLRPEINSGIRSEPCSGSSSLDDLPYMMALPPVPIAGCPPGLEHMVYTGLFYVQHCRSAHIIPEIRDVESRDRYQILNTLGERIYYAVGNSPDFWRYGLSGARPFHITVMDHLGQTVLTLKRPLSCGLCWFGGECSGNKIEIRYSNGDVLGYVKQRFTCISPLYFVKDAYGRPWQYAQGPPIACCPFCCLRYYSKFRLYNHSRSSTYEGVIGKFKNFPFGIGLENISNTMSLSFPSQLEVENKAVLLGLLFLVYFMYFEVTDSFSGLNSNRHSTIVSARVSDWTDTNRVPFKGIRGGDVPGKCYPCKIIFVCVLILFLIFFILLATNDYPFSDIEIEGAPEGETAMDSILSLVFSK